jgi:protein involved in polysaccharide export with SLBB domain
MNKTQSIKVIVLAFVVVLLAGCGNRFFDPTQIGRWRPTPAVNVILDSLGVAEETPVPWKKAEEPKPSDIVAVESDYVFRSGDIVRVAIFELFREGLTFANDFVVTETGKVSIPDVGVVQVAGLTETQLEEEIRQILSPSILKNPSVNVTLINSQQRTFSILGDGVPRPGRYVIPRYDFRLTDALAMAGGPAQFNVSYIYVSRHKPESRYEPAGQVKPRAPQQELSGLETVQPENRQQRFAEPRMRESERPGSSSKPDAFTPQSPKKRQELEREMLELIAPQAQYEWPKSKKVVISSTEMVRDQELANAGVARDFGLSMGHNWNWNEPSYTRGTTWRSEGLRMMGRGARPRTQQSPRAGGNNSQRTLSRQANRSASPAPEDVEWIYRNGQWVPVPVDARQPSGPTEGQPRIPVPQKQQGQRIEWAFRNGQWVPMQPGVQQPVEPPPKRGGERGPAEREQEKGRVEWVFRNGKWVPVPVGPAEPTKQAPAEIQPVPEEKEKEVPRIEWVFRDGRWVPVQVGPPGPERPEIRMEQEKVVPLEEKIAEETQWEEAIQSRVLKIPADKLLAGDPRYNVVIKAGDSIHVPVDVIGEFCIMGNVNRRGYINLTGRPMTLKMAIAAAGGLGPLAWPKKCEVIRRIGENKEEIVMVDLDKIARGEQPDFFIKPNDLINVGTHATSRWRAILRNAFRATYGFGFVYDRNFADHDYYKGFRLPSWL